MKPEPQTKPPATNKQCTTTSNPSATKNKGLGLGGGAAGIVDDRFDLLWVWGGEWRLAEGSLQLDVCGAFYKTDGSFGLQPFHELDE